MPVEFAAEIGQHTHGNPSHQVAIEEIECAAHDKNEWNYRTIKQSDIQLSSCASVRSSQSRSFIVLLWKYVLIHLVHHQGKKTGGRSKQCSRDQRQGKLEPVRPEKRIEFAVRTDYGPEHLANGKFRFTH